MAYNNNYPQNPFWDFVRSMDQNRAGVDHTANHPFDHHPPPPPHPAGAHPPPPPPPPGAYPSPFPFGGGWEESHGPYAGWFGGQGSFGGPSPHGRGGRRGRHCRRERGQACQDNENEQSRSRTASPCGEAHPENEDRAGPSASPRRGGPHSRGRHGGSRGHHGRRGPPPPPFAGPGGIPGFDLNSLFDSLNSHPIGQQPWAQMLRQYAQQAGFGGTGNVSAQESGEARAADADDESDNSFIPPIDIFSTESAYVLHVALPGAKKEDVGVNWDAEKGELNIAGVVYRQGDEIFLKTLKESERKVGVFERSVKLPLGEEKEEVDGDGITAKLEDGVLVVDVPKVEREGWTDVKRVEVK